MVLKVNVVSCFHLEALESFLSLRNYDVTLRHSIVLLLKS